MLESMCTFDLQKSAISFTKWENVHFLHPHQQSIRVLGAPHSY